MTITQLKYVLSVAEYKNFTIAAEHSFVTQPTLSMQIQKLEDHLGVLIFNRSKKPIELTDIGLKVVEQAKVVVNESNRIVDIQPCASFRCPPSVGTGRMNVRMLS